MRKRKPAKHPVNAAKSIEQGFPILEVSKLGEQESWRKEVNRPIYHIHKWWATRLGSVFRAVTLGALKSPPDDIWRSFYDVHKLTGKVVLDPFMGSGTTLGEALKLGARVVGCDINPVSTFQVRQAFTAVPIDELRDAFSRLENQVSREIRRYYQTTDPQSGKAIPVLYYFWCRCVDTPEGDRVPLLSRYVFSQNAYPKKKPQAQIVCAKCWDVFEGRFDLVAAECPHCGHLFNPQIGPAQGQNIQTPSGRTFKIKELLPKSGAILPSRLFAIMALRPDGSKIYLPARKEDFELFQEASVRLKNENLPLPVMEVRPGHNTDQARGYNFLNWKDFFNDRQLLCLGLLLNAILEIEDIKIQEQLLCLFSSTLEFNNQFCSFKGEGTGAVRHMFSNHILKPERVPLENSVWGTSKSSGTYSTLFESRLLRAKRYLAEPFELIIDRDLTGEPIGTRKILASAPLKPHLVSSWESLLAHESSALVLNGDSAALPIPDESIDAVVTDPPYFDFVHYSELSDFFYAWLAPVLADRYPWMRRRDSSAAGEVQHKDPMTFSSQLAKVFSECHRVLKPCGVMVFSFHHSRSEGWAAILEAVTSAGFMVVAAHPVHAELRAASPKIAAKSPISLDAILVCKRRKDIDTWPATQSAETVASEMAAQLEAGKYRLSTADYFVVLASQLLVELSQAGHSYDIARTEIAERWERFKACLASD